jgi:hypothetical protein
MDKNELVMSLRSKVFGDRGTDIQAAWNYADSIISTLGDRGPMWTAVHVLMNTIANAIDALPDPLAAPTEEIKIETIQLSLDRATLDDIIDARIANWYEHEFDIQEEVNGAINEYDFEETVRDIVKHNITFSIDVD